MEQGSLCHIPMRLMVSNYLSPLSTDQLELLLGKGLEGLVRSSASSAGILWACDGRELHSVAVRNASELSSPIGRRLSLGEGLTGRCVAQCQPLTTSDLSSDRHLALRQMRYDSAYDSVAAAPAGLHGLPIGAVTVFGKSGRHYTPGDLTRLQAGVERLALISAHCIKSPEHIGAWISQIDSGVLDGSSTPRIAQKTIDKERDSLPKGISGPTLDLILQALERKRKPTTCEELVLCTGISYKTVRRYLSYMADSAIVRRDAVYGTVGRPTNIYSVPEWDHVIEV